MLSYEVWAAGVRHGSTTDPSEVAALEAAARDAHPGATPSRTMTRVIPLSLAEREVAPVIADWLGEKSTLTGLAVACFERGYIYRDGVA